MLHIGLGIVSVVVIIFVVPGIFEFISEPKYLKPDVVRISNCFAEYIVEILSNSMLIVCIASVFRNSKPYSNFFSSPVSRSPLLRYIVSFFCACDGRIGKQQTAISDIANLIVPELIIIKFQVPEHKYIQGEVKDI
jgi:hypothetical protein